MMMSFFGVYLGVIGVLWGAFWSCLRPFRGPPGASQDEAKRGAHSASRFSEDVSNGIAIFELRRLKTRSPNCYFSEDVSSETAISEYSSYFATHCNISCFRGCLERELHFLRYDVLKHLFQHPRFSRMSHAKRPFPKIFKLFRDPLQHFIFPRMSRARASLLT